MKQDQSLPDLWLLSDARNDAALKAALKALPRGSGFVFRHYHLEGEERRRTFLSLKLIARFFEHRVILSDTPTKAREWGADGVYGNVQRLGPKSELLRLATAHNGDEIQLANKAGVDGIFLSPVFPTHSHPDDATLGVMGFNVLVQQSLLPVIALGGMTEDNAKRLSWPRWGAIDGLS